MRIKFLIFLFIFFLTGKSFSQNLLVNGSFEEENICTEYRVNCAPEGWINTSDGFGNYYKDLRRAYEGSHFISIEAGKTRNRFKRNYFRAQLLCVLRKGNKYRLEMYVSARQDILDSIGIYFTPYDFLFEKNITYKIVPNLYFADGNRFVKGDSSWQKVVLEYTATGTERYLTIGNFSKRDFNGETGVPYENRFFVYIDKVSFVPSNPNEKICPEWRSTRNRIYEFDERHEYLQRYVTYYRTNNKLPDPPIMGPTRFSFIDTLIVPDVLFAFNRSDLQRNSYKVLDSFCTRIRNHKIDSMIVEGHTDSTGSVVYNWQLSMDRSVRVANYLIFNCKLDQESIITRCWGPEKPVADNRTPDGRQRNRRVEILLYIRE